MLTLSKVTNAVPATDEYAVLMGLVETPSPRSINMTVNPVLSSISRNPEGNCIAIHLRFTPSGKVVSERSISNPPVGRCDEKDGGDVTALAFWSLSQPRNHHLAPP